MLTGASGGSKIISATFQSIVNVIEYELPLYDAIAFGRVHDQLFPNQLKIDATDDNDHSYPDSHIEFLEELGHIIRCTNISEN